MGGEAGGSIPLRRIVMFGRLDTVMILPGFCPIAAIFLLQAPYIGKGAKLNLPLELVSYNFWKEAKLNILLKTKGLLKK